MPDANERLETSDDLARLTAHLASLDLDPPTLEMLMAALTIDLREVDASSS